MSIRDRLDQLDLSPEADALLTTWFSNICADTDSEGSFLNAMRWWALGMHNYEVMWEALAGYKLKSGTVCLLNAILGDGGAEPRLESPVVEVASNADGVDVTCSGGEIYSAATTVVATPTGVWPDLEFSPPLPDEQVQAAREGMQTPYAAKAIVVLKGERRRLYILARPEQPLGLMFTSHMRADDEQVAIVFPSPAMKDAGDPNAVKAAIEDVLPRVEVTEVLSGTYYVDDPLARGGWSFLKRGQLTRYAPHERFTRHGGRVVFATADLSAFWTSFIDGRSRPAFAPPARCASSSGSCRPRQTTHRRCPQRGAHTTSRRGQLSEAAPQTSERTPNRGLARE
jgi:hypothetical protein